MRHVLGLLFGIVLAPVTWFLASLGHFRFLDALQRFGDDTSRLPSELAFGAMLIIAAGAWLGVLLSSRLSPLAPAAAGLLWLGLGAAFVVNVERVVNLLPDGPSGQQGLFALPLEHGYAFLIGTALMSPLFSPARWRGGQRRPQAADESILEPETPAVPSYQTGSYPTIADTAEPPTSADRRDRYARPARASFPDDAASADPTGYRGARGQRDSTATYRGGQVDYRDPTPTGRQAAVPEQQPPRLSSWNEDTADQPRHRPRDR